MTGRVGFIATPLQRNWSRTHRSCRGDIPRKSGSNIRRDSSFRPQTDSFVNYLKTLLSAADVVGC